MVLNNVPAEVDENTPSEDAWEKAKELCDNTIKMYCERHKGENPRKVSYTLWSSEFIETEGATIAQILYMIGVEPVSYTHLVPGMASLKDETLLLQKRFVIILIKRKW